MFTLPGPVIILHHSERHLVGTRSQGTAMAKLSENARVFITQAASWYTSMEAFHDPVSRVTVSPGFQVSGFKCLVALKGTTDANRGLSSHREGTRPR
jgi:hypothetical protein